MNNAYYKMTPAHPEYNNYVEQGKKHKQARETIENNIKEPAEI